MHFIFGSKDPSKRAPRLRKKGDLFYSESNYNLFIEDAAEVTLGDFISAVQFPDPSMSVHAGSPVRILDAGLDLCDACWESTRVPCALFQNPKAKAPPDVSISELAKAVVWPYDSTEPLEFCPIVQKLLAMTETPTESRFYWLYFRYARSIYHTSPRTHGFTSHTTPRIIERAYSGDLLADSGGDLGGTSWCIGVNEELLHQLNSPVLIPQVVLNFVAASNLPEDHPDKHFYDRQAGRVDFLYLQGATQHIIEIGGPYPSGSEEEYTKMLRRDRTLCRLGYHVHRFSNMEVMQAKGFDTFAWELFY